MKWSTEETNIIKQYENTNKKASDIYQQLSLNGHNRTLKAVRRKIESMRLGKPYKNLDICNLPKILMLDIETTPIPVWAWSLGKQYIQTHSMMKDSDGKVIDWYVLSWSAKWLYDDKVLSDVLTSKEAVSRNDKRILHSVWKLLDEADIIIAHNGDKFDLRKIKARFLSNNIMPPMPYKTIDTLKIARKEFALSSNKQDYITKLLGVQKKLDTDFQLWIDCMNGDTKALKKMERYNKHDVIGLEQMYLKLRPYMTGHPNIAVMMEENVCSTCGSDSLNNVGKYYFTGSSKYELYYCNGCMSPHIRGKNNVSEKNIFVRSAAK